ncbi:uncharacterized protein M6B38_418255 [Iris pallida]|uniref:Uncharacterized protein n=1 Tax=Iris pallida TaxID=29817 RepID=A0AAX6FJ00_IRIPA|nr:uncharacterized protein M6B38_418255 [Iris pallida]
MLAAYNPLKKVLAIIEKMFISFFWGKATAGSWRIWSSWKSTAMTVEEGGMGCRWITKVMDAFSTKLWL